MRTSKIVAMALVLAPFLVGAPTSAHHSFAMFDMQKKVTLQGAVVRFKWTNPHSWLELDVAGKTGTDRWAIEMTSPNNLALEGWKRTTVKPGDKVVLIVHPLRDGGKGGSFVGVRLPDGSTLGDVK